VDVAAAVLVTIMSMAVRIHRTVAMTVAASVSIDAGLLGVCHGGRRVAGALALAFTGMPRTRRPFRGVRVARTDGDAHHLTSRHADPRLREQEECDHET
jgi:hypothetical protein